MRVTRVRFEHCQHAQAFGIEKRSPRVSWSFEGAEKDWAQVAYEVEVRRNGVSAKFAVASSQSSLVPWPTSALSERETAQVRVRVTSEEGAVSEWSDPAIVEAGIDHDSWTSKLIEFQQDFGDVGQPHRPVQFRHTFNLADEFFLQSARLYITAHGVYESYLNGQPIGDHVLAPGWTSYDHHLAYQTFDVLPHLKSGKNVLAAIVGEGWYCGRLGFEGGKSNIWGQRVGLQALLVLTSETGETIFVGTDETWKASFGALLSSSIYDGEVLDARLVDDRWLVAEFDDSKWERVTVANNLPEKCRLVASKSPPIREVQKITAQSIQELGDTGSLVIDFGQNLVGKVKIGVSGAASGDRITLKHAEVLRKDGHVDMRPLRLAKATDEIILNGPEELVWKPRFTVHGFRYVEISGWYGALTLSHIEAVVIHSDMERTGWFSCSDPQVSKLHENILWSMRGNFVGVPTDCPQRDERLGWSGDLALFVGTANYLYNTHGFLSSWLEDAAAEQKENDEGVPSLATPDIFRDPNFSPPIAIWGDSSVIVPSALYQSFGDREMLEAHANSAFAWLDRGIPRDERGLWKTRGVDQLGDWLDPSAPPSEPGLSRTDGVLIANAFLVHVTRLASSICGVLGLENKKASYAQDADKLQHAFAEEYISPRGRVVNDTQTAIALCVFFKLFNTPEQRAVAAARLKDIIRADSRFKLTVGFAGASVLGPALSELGETQLFYRMLQHKRLPSWLYPVTMGATTMWERWDSLLPDGSVNPGAMTSFNHYAFGAVGEWIHTVMVGLKPLVPGWKRFTIAPIPGGTITSVDAKYLSPYGFIRVSWKVEGEKFLMDAEVPPNTKAEVTLPGMLEVLRVGSGNHHFEAAYHAPEWPPKPIYRLFDPHDDDEP